MFSQPWASQELRGSGHPAAHRFLGLLPLVRDELIQPGHVSPVWKRLCDFLHTICETSHYLSTVLGEGSEGGGPWELQRGRVGEGLLKSPKPGGNLTDGRGVCGAASLRKGSPTPSPTSLGLVLRHQSMSKLSSHTSQYNDLCSYLCLQKYILFVHLIMTMQDDPGND